ncbi:hypothetical protein RUESEDTHA_04114 [Ruegeria sp. THAF57]|uniref:lipoyl protein ligase domain-containing protein n=1 Tax=Ruegeria sp. THAF57 TaxID=2744555 RepID=UPI0015DDD43C|nr:hypothetical protein [Ruegeria sp. THAF57]CAD0187202.1 hypothetical protein RUESEDTHA_04114 [Ruegeria sp. THAF57]
MITAARQVQDVSEGLAFEADLMAAHGPAAGVWQAAHPALVCPEAYRAKPGFAAAVAASDRCGWPVHTRPTGGGAVPQGPGVLNLALAFTVARGFTIADGYRLIAGIIRQGAGPAGRHLTAGPTPHSFCDGDWNLSLDGRKVVGTAQRWRPLGSGRTRVLAHALILTGGDLRPGAEAVSAFGAALGFASVDPEVHTKLAPTPDLAAALLTAAEDSLCAIDNQNEAA